MKYQFVDCRWELGKPDRGRDLYLGGHIPGASYLDVDSDLSSPAGARGRHPLPDPKGPGAAAGRAGLGGGVFVGAYGNMGGAERLWWLLRHFGHDACAVVELEAWHGPLTAGEEQGAPARLGPRGRGGARRRARGGGGGPATRSPATSSPRAASNSSSSTHASSPAGAASRT